MTEKLDHGDPLQGESIADLGTTEVLGKKLFVSRWKWHGARGEQIIFSEKKGFVPQGSWKWASVKYRPLTDTDIVFSGISIPSELHGGGNFFFRHFLSDMEKKGKKVVGTDVIRKPIIAQMLVRAGWIPESSAHVVEILPRSKYADDGLPQVHAVNNNVRNSSKSKDFFKVVDPREVERTYPMTNPDISNVAILTRYFPPKAV